MRSIPKTSASVALVAALLLVGCRGDRGPEFVPAGATEPHRGGVLVYSVVDGLRTLDPLIAYDEYTFGALHHMLDTLVGYEPAFGPDQGNEVAPQLAKSWTISDDAKTYTFHLRRGLTYWDGSPVVAGDFVYALERCLTHQSSPFAQFIFGIVGAEALSKGDATTLAGATTPDDLTLVIELAEPDASFLYIMAMPFAAPQKRAFIESLSKQQLRTTLLGTGPFKMKKWDEGTVLVLERNDNYWDPAIPYLDGIVLYESIKRDTAFLKFQAGELMTVDRLSSADFIYVAGHKEWRQYLYNVPNMNVYGEKMNVTKKPFTDKRVRQALNYALNKDNQIKLMNGLGVAAHGILPPMMPGYDSTLKPYPHDPEKAKALLAEAGYPNGFSITYTTLADPRSEKLAQALQSDMAKVGVKVEIELMTFPTYLDASARPDGLAFAYTAWFMDYPDPSNFVDVRFHTKMIAEQDSNNDTFYSNPKLDQMMDAAKAEVDPDKRWRMYNEIEQLLYDECPWIWNYHRNSVEMRQPYVMNYYPHPVWLRDYRYTWLDVGPSGKPVKKK